MAIMAAIGVMIVVLVLLRNPGDRVLAGLVAAFVCGIPLAFLAFATYQIRKLKGLMFQPVDHEAAVFSTSQSAPLPKTVRTRPNTGISVKDGYRELVALARPRKLKMTWRGRLYSVSGAVIVILYSYFRFPATWSLFWQSYSHGIKGWLLLGWPVIIYGYAFVFLRNRLRERHLIANGEVASGYVVAQQNSRYTQSIQYSFQDATERVINANCNDPSRSLYEGMTVPVFYDRENPDRSLPLPCSLTTIDTD